MIRTEQLTINDTEYTRTYSDSGFLIHGGEPEGDYTEALDPTELGRVYTETDIPIESDDSNAEEVLDILMGVSE